MGIFLKKKTLRILLPFIVIGGCNSLLLNTVNFYDIFIGKYASYWFLPALFYCMIVEMIANYVVYFVNKKNNPLIDIFIHLFFFATISAIYLLGIGKSIPYYLNFSKMYPFFIMGVFFMKYEKFRNMIKSSNAVFSICVVLYLLVEFATYHHPNMPLKFTGFFAIPILVQIFLSFDNKIPNFVTKVGQQSLEIYCFHWFFLPSIIGLGQWFVEHSEDTTILFNGNFVLLAMLTFLISIPIIAICIVISKILHRSKLLNAICFGEIAPKSIKK